MAFVPRTAVVLGWPAFVRWEEASNEHPNTWWAKPNPNVLINFSELVQENELWGWQVALKQQVCRYFIPRTQSWQILRQATEFIAESKLQSPAAVDAFMTRYTQRPADQLSWSIADYRSKMQNIDAKWVEPVAAAVVAEPIIARIDKEVVRWLGNSGRSMNDVAGALLDKKWQIDTLNTLLYSLSESSVDAPHAGALIRSYAKRKGISGTAITRLVGMADLDASEALQPLATAISHQYPFDRMYACVAIAERGELNPALLDLLEMAKNDTNEGVCLAASIAQAVLTQDDVNLREEVRGAARFLGEVRERDRRIWTVSALYLFASKRLLPRELCEIAMFGAAEGDVLDNWLQSAQSMSLLIELRGTQDLEVVALAARKIEEGGQIGWSAWYAYVQKGSAPRIIIDAAKRGATKASAQRQLQMLKEADAIKVEP